MMKLKDRTVLIVDDDRMIRESLKTLLKREFYEILLAADGKSALEIVDEKKTQIVLLDINLPDMDGLDVLSEIRKRNFACEVIVITGIGNREIAIESLRRGAIDYIEKPVDMLELYAAMGRAEEKLAEIATFSYKNRILVVDDEELVVGRLKRYLEKDGFDVVTANSGKAALEIVANFRIDVIIADIHIGDMDGITIVQKAKSLFKDIEAIMVTGFRDQDLAIRSLRAGAIDYITKPINLDELTFSVNKAIETIDLKRNSLYRNRELKLSSEIVSKMNQDLEKRVTDRTRALSETQAQLFQTSKLATLGEMSAGLAHEINQPLNAIALTVTFFKKLLSRGAIDEEELKTGLLEIEQCIERMTKVIQHIRTFARQEVMDFVEVDINKTISSAIGLLREQLRLHEIEVVLNFSPDLPHIIGEPYQLEQVWINLISNARDSVDEKKKRISENLWPIKDYEKKLIISTNSKTTPQGTVIEACFADNGIGLSEKNKARVFEPFYTTKEVGSSTGLGLSISHGIVESHKGSIEMESIEREGATVRVTIPIGGK